MSTNRVRILVGARVVIPHRDAPFPDTHVTCMGIGHTELPQPPGNPNAHVEALRRQNVPDLSIPSPWNAQAKCLGMHASSHHHGPMRSLGRRRGPRDLGGTVSNWEKASKLRYFLFTATASRCNEAHIVRSPLPCVSLTCRDDGPLYPQAQAQVYMRSQLDGDPCAYLADGSHVSILLY